MGDKNSDRRAKAEAARNAANAGEKKRERITRIVGAVVVIVVVLGIIGIAVVARNSSSETAGGSTATADPNAPAPKGTFPTGDEYAYGVPFNDAANVPVMEIWEDFQCPACQSLEKANGAGIEHEVAQALPLHRQPRGHQRRQRRPGQPAASTTWTTIFPFRFAVPANRPSNGPFYFMPR
jgi:protein-disulfide isomerase